MIYKLAFNDKARKEWNKLSPNVKDQLKRKLIERLKNPKVVSAKLRGFKNCYKIKLRTVAYRLVYQVKDSELVVIVVAIGKRENNLVYNSLDKRL